MGYANNTHDQATVNDTEAIFNALWKLRQMKSNRQPDFVVQ